MNKQKDNENLPKIICETFIPCNACPAACNTESDSLKIVITSANNKIETQDSLLEKSETEVIDSLKKIVNEQKKKIEEVKPEDSSPWQRLETFLILIAIMLFILSQLSERVANTIKLSLGLDRNEDDDKPKDDKRVRNVLHISLISGWLISLLLLTMVGSSSIDLPEHLIWIEQLNGYQILIFIILSSIFLSFGSKFWHDTLGLLYEYKKKTRESERFNSNSDSPELKQKLKIVSRELTDKARKANRHVFLATPGISATSTEKDSNGNYFIQLHIDEDEYEGLNKSKIDFEGVDIPTKTTVTGKFEFHVGPGGEICNEDNSEGDHKNYGTFGAVVKYVDNDEEYLLSCYHVLKSNKYTFSKFPRLGERPGSLNIFDTNSYDIIAHLEEGLINSEIDAAIAKLAPSFTNRKNTFGNIIVRNHKSVKDLKEESIVYFKGATDRNIRKAILKNTDCDLVGPLKLDGREYQMNNLLAISKSNGYSPSYKGDSGSLVYDGEHEAIGLLIGGDNHYSYLVPIETIFKQLNVYI